MSIRLSVLSEHCFSTLAEILDSLGLLETIIFIYFIQTTPPLTLLEVVICFLGLENSVIKWDPKDH